MIPRFAAFHPTDGEQLKNAVNDCVFYHKAAEGNHGCNVEVEIEACKSWCVEVLIFIPTIFQKRRRSRNCKRTFSNHCRDLEWANTIDKTSCMHLLAILERPLTNCAMPQLFFIFLYFFVFHFFILDDCTEASSSGAPRS